MYQKGIRKRGNSFQFNISVGSDGDGNPIRKYQTYTPPPGLTEAQTRKAVEAAYIDFQREVSHNPTLMPTMLLEKLAEEYFTIYAPASLKEVTVYTYKGSYEKNIRPVFGKKKLKDITTISITEFLMELGKDKKPETVRKNKIIFHSILKYAVSQGYIERNPCIGTVWAKDVEGDGDKIVNVLTLQGAKELMRLTQAYSAFNTIINVLIRTGLRSGEILGLRWSSVNFDEKTIFVDKTLSYIKGKYYLSVPKTVMSRRAISIDDTVVKLLLKHREEQDKLKEKVGTAWVNPDMIFTSATGRYYDRCLLNTQFRRLLSRNPQISRITIHGLRHTNATLLILANENMDAIAKHLGHASSDITSRVYAHTIAEINVRISKTISSVLD